MPMRTPVKPPAGKTRLQKLATALAVGMCVGFGLCGVAFTAKSAHGWPALLGTTGYLVFMACFLGLALLGVWVVLRTVVGFFRR